MSLEIPGIPLEISKELPSNNTLESLYEINNQSIWFLIWILKKVRFWPDLIREALEEPFLVERMYWSNGQIRYVEPIKNNKVHGISRGWYKNGKIKWLSHMKDNKNHGKAYGWHENGHLAWEGRWKDDVPIHLLD